MRYSFRVLRKNPSFTLVAALTLALGIGANTAIFSVMNTMLLRQMPFRDPQKLVMVWEANPALDSLVAERVQASLQNFSEWREQNHVFDGMASFRYSTFDLAGEGNKPEQLKAAPVSPGFFDVLGVQGMILGRAFTEQDSEPGKNHVVMLSDSLFQRRFGGNPKILGQSLTMNGVGYMIVGVLPRQFRLPSFRGGMEQFKPEVWVPADIDPKQRQSDLLQRRLYTFARLKPSATIESARSEMAVISKRLEEKYPQHDRTWGSSVFPLADEDIGAGMRRTLLVLECSVGFVLLIACANVINLQLTRAQARGRELAIRVALGASRWRMVKQMLSESLALSALGGVAGILLANWGISAIVALAPADIHRLEDVQVDGAVLLFTLVITVLSGVLFGLAPAVLAARQDPQDALRRGGRTGGGGGISASIRKALVIAEVALSLVLLAGAGLMIRSMKSLLTVTPGFRSDHLLTLQIDLRPDRYHNAEQGGLFVNDLLERLGKLPGVASAAVANDLPMRSIQMSGYRVEGAPALPPGQSLVADLRDVSDQYIDTMGMTLVAGRGFTREEAEKANPAQLIVNETLARKLWPNQSPIGKVLLSTRESGPGAWRREVVGVVGDSRQLSLDTPSRPEIFFPVRKQFPSLTVVVRTVGDPLRIAPAVTEQVWAIDKNQPVHDVDAMDHIVDDTVSQRRFNMLLLAFFAGTALALAAVGIYGVVAYTVSRRTQEIGIRVALGAQTGDVLRLIGGEGLLLVAAGIGIGLTGALALTRLMSSLLFGVSPTDAATFAVVPTLLAVVGIAACYVPARRAARVDPTVSLRSE